MTSELQSTMQRLQNQNLHLRTPKLTADHILPFHVYFSPSVLRISSLTRVLVSFSRPFCLSVYLPRADGLLQQLVAQ